MLKHISLNKIKGKTLVLILLNVLLIGIVAYEVFFLKELYSTLSQKNFDFTRAAKVRTDISGYKKASERYRASFNYQPSNEPLPNPFQ